jgi:hypothetical protein
MTDPRVTYRDATYSAETQRALRSLRAWILLPPMARGGVLTSELRALEDVIARWDANDATETVFDPGDAA